MRAGHKGFAGIALVGFLALGVIFTGCKSDSITTPVAEAPLLAPQNVTVSQNAYGNVMISWDRNSQSNLRGYNVYRLDVEASAIGRLTISPVAENFYTDETAVWEKDYEYRVTSVSTRGNESVYSSSLYHVDTPTRSGAKLRPDV